MNIYKFDVNYEEKLKKRKLKKKSKNSKIPLPGIEPESIK